jgi:hypothetical protein
MNFIIRIIESGRQIVAHDKKKYERDEERSPYWYKWMVI